MSVNLKLDWCSHAAAKYAVMHWHYSETMPVGKLAKIGVWEDNKFIGCIIFGRGANKSLLKPYGLNQDGGCELVRIALDKHVSTVTKIMSIAIKMLKKQFTKLELIVSFADSNQKHLGIIYQAGNWIYTGKTSEEYSYFYNNKWMHRRSAGSARGTIVGLEKKDNGHRKRYLYPLSKDIRDKVVKLSKPYPKNCPAGVNGNTPSFQGGDRGSNPTVGLK